MTDYRQYVKFDGQLLLIGFGCIGRGVLPLLLRHIGMRPDQITIIDPSHDGMAAAREYGIELVVQPIERDNYQEILDMRLRPGDFVLNLAVNVSSIALVDYCQRRGLLYLDACIEPWAGGYFDTSLSSAERSNYAAREAALALRRRYGKGPTAVLTHGANPGIVSHFVKQALLNIADDIGIAYHRPITREQWAQLAHGLGVKVIHVAERDTQHGRQRKQPGEFVNTWSSDGFMDEATQPAELGWGSHERHWPREGRRFEFGGGSAIYLNRPGALTKVRSWTPQQGPYHGLLISHGESISIAAYLSHYEEKELRYRPTVHYAYHPSDDTLLSLHEFVSRNFCMQPQRRLLMDDIVDGIDELGVLLMGHARGAYWYGSQLSTDAARKLAPHNSATSLQVTAGVLGGIVWALRRPAEGIVEPDEMEYEEVLEVASPYLGPMVGVYSDWTPLRGRRQLFEEVCDRADPWQFINFLVD